MINKTLTAAALAAVLATPAFAQSTAPKPSTTPMAQPSDTSKPGTTGTMMKKPSDTMNKPDAAASSTPAQSAGSTDSADKKQAGFVQNQDSADWRASKLIGASVYGPDNASIGEINDLVLEGDGGVKAVVVGVGGFLGMGEKDVAIPFDALNVKRKADSASIDKITVTYTKDDLKNAPKFAFYKDVSSTTGSSSASRPMSPPPASSAPK